jgi:hypothetical protein
MTYGRVFQLRVEMDLHWVVSSFRLARPKTRQYPKTGKAVFGAGRIVVLTMMELALRKGAGKPATLATAIAP